MNPQTKTFKNIHQTPETTTIFHDLLDLTAKLLGSKLTKLELSHQKTRSALEDLKYSVKDLNHELRSMQSDQFTTSSLQSKKDPVSLSNEIRQYFKKREKSLEQEYYEANIDYDFQERKRIPSPHNDLHNVGYNPNVLKNSSSYKDFVQMMENTSNGKSERKKSPDVVPISSEKEREKSQNETSAKPKENEENNGQTPNYKGKNHKKTYHYYFNSSNDRKLNGLINDGHARKEKEIPNGAPKKDRKNTIMRKKEAFQKELTKNFTVLTSKSKEKVVTKEEGEIIDSNRTQKIGETMVEKKISAKTEEKSNERNNEKIMKNGPKSNQQSVSCERTHEDAKIRSPSSSSTKFLNYYYFFDKNKETQIAQTEEN